MKLSARNQLPGRVAAIELGAVEALIKVDLGGGQTISAVITVEAANDMGLAVGDDVVAIVKADHVILGK